MFCVNPCPNCNAELFEFLEVSLLESAEGGTEIEINCPGCHSRLRSQIEARPYFYNLELVEKKKEKRT